MRSATSPLTKAHEPKKTTGGDVTPWQAYPHTAGQKQQQTPNQDPPATFDSNGTGPKAPAAPNGTTSPHYTHT